MCADVRFWGITMLYLNGLGPYQAYMNAALVGAIILAAGYAIFLVNIVRTISFKTLLSIFYQPQKPPALVQVAIEQRPSADHSVR